MATKNRVRKICQTCGSGGIYRPRDRKCRVINNGAFGAKTFCWGPLQRIVKPKVKVTIEAELAHAHKGLVQAITRLKRATTSIGQWQRKIKSVERRLDERDHPRPKVKRVKKVRGIAIDDVAEDVAS